MGTFIEENADIPLVRHMLGLARKSDPPESHAAAARTPRFRSGHKAAILSALEAGPAGQTELARRTGMTVAAVSRRLKDLRDDGAIVRDGDAVSASGGREARWKKRPGDKCQ